MKWILYTKPPHANGKWIVVTSFKTKKAAEQCGKFCLCEWKVEKCKTK